MQREEQQRNRETAASSVLAYGAVSMRLKKYYEKPRLDGMPRVRLVVANKSGKFKN